MIYVILIAVVLAFGIGVVLWNRSRAAARREANAAPAPVAKPAPKKPAPMPAAPPAAPAKVPVAEEPVDAAPVAEVEPVEETVAEPVAEKASFRNRMSKARGALTGALLGVRARTGITDETWDDLEEALLRADVGVRVTDDLLGGLKSRVKSKQITTPDGLLEALQADMRGRLEQSARELTFAGDDGQTDVWLFVGVNGVGKTTTIGKVSAQQTALGRKVMMAAGDTFRAAAAEQLTTWAERSGAEIVRGNEGGDPSAVIFDAIEKASARHFDLVLADTAGRLHTKTNLMDELRKVRRVAAKGNGNVTEVLLVIDATTGQNGLTQAREFGDATEVTGVVLTKLDGSAKGGIVFAIETELGLPVKLVGLGETIGDLVPFDPQEFIEALFG